jgi:mannitol/fructose-specific phosphotransferase system IIA component (Ntr-type)
MHRNQSHPEIKVPDGSNVDDDYLSIPLAQPRRQRSVSRPVTLQAARRSSNPNLLNSPGSSSQHGHPSSGLPVHTENESHPPEIKIDFDPSVEMRRSRSRVASMAMSRNDLLRASFVRSINNSHENLTSMDHGAGNISPTASRTVGGSDHPTSPHHHMSMNLGMSRQNSRSILSLHSMDWADRNETSHTFHELEHKMSAIAEIRDVVEPPTEMAEWEDHRNSITYLREQLINNTTIIIQDPAVGNYFEPTEVLTIVMDKLVANNALTLPAVAKILAQEKAKDSEKIRLEFSEKRIVHVYKFTSTDITEPILCFARAPMGPKLKAGFVFISIAASSPEIDMPNLIVNDRDVSGSENDSDVDTYNYNSSTLENLDQLEGLSAVSRQDQGERIAEFHERYIQCFLDLLSDADFYCDAVLSRAPEDVITSIDFYLKRLEHAQKIAEESVADVYVGRDELNLVTSLKNMLAPGNVMLAVHGTEVDVIIDSVLTYLVNQNLLSAHDFDNAKAALLSSEEEHEQAVGEAFDVIAGRMSHLKEPVIALARLKRPTNLGAADGLPTRFIWVALLPNGYDMNTLGDAIIYCQSNEEFHCDLIMAHHYNDIIASFDNLLLRMKREVEPEEDPGLLFSGRPLGGVWKDMRRRLSPAAYWKDIKRGGSFQIVIGIVFMYFAMLTPTLAFGGLMSAGTNGDIGVVEMIIATSFCGLVFSIVGGQFLLLLGGTGPVVVFTLTLYNTASLVGVKFLPLYWWVGFWACIFTVIAALTELSIFIRIFTRFTDEIFAALIAFIFIYEGLKYIIYTTLYTVDTAVALLSIIIVLGAFYVAKSLKEFKSSPYLPSKLRELLADLGAPIAILLMTFVSLYFQFARGVSVVKLPVPDLDPVILLSELSLDPREMLLFSYGTTAGRPWIVNPFDVPFWVPLVAPLVSLLLCLLLYLEQNITARILNNAEHKLKNGSSYHWDLMITGLCVGVCSIFGLPWMVAAAVQSINHLLSNAVLEEFLGRDGNVHRHIVGVREQRVSGFFIALLIGLTLLIVPILKFVPLSALFGVFIFMGVVVLGGNQFFSRLKLFFTQPELYPPSHYVRRVPRHIIHSFTVIQIALLVFLWIVKSLPVVAVLFPLVVVLFALLRRYLLNRIYRQEYLEALDSEEADD